MTEFTKDSLDHLLAAAVNERRLNDKLMQTKRGKIITFGEVIQLRCYFLTLTSNDFLRFYLSYNALRHVKSKKFLTVSYFQLAEQERENMRVTVEVDIDRIV